MTTFDGVYDGGATDGTWTFMTDQIRTYEPGEYEFTIEGVTGIDSFQTTQATFTFTIVNPCPLVTLSLIDNPLTNVTYSLRDP